MLQAAKAAPDFLLTGGVTPMRTRAFLAIGIATGLLTVSWRVAAQLPVETSTALPDFNGDNRADLVIGVPGGDGGKGLVVVLYGTAQGFTGTAKRQTWRQGQNGVLEVGEPGDNFGAVLATGNFNGDAYTDLAIGAPGEDNQSCVDRGTVNVLYGSSVGLTSNNDQLVKEFGSACGPAPENLTLTSGDFNGDARDDLVVGILMIEQIYVFQGSASGLPTYPTQTWGFGAAVAAGDFNADGRSDLAIGAPNRDVGLIPDAGSVTILHGTSTGLSTVGSQFWTQDSAGIVDLAEPYDRFGAALAVGDFNGDGRGDLAIGVPDEGVFGRPAAGAVNVIYGSATGLSSAGNQFWTQDTPVVLEASEPLDRFGWSLGAGNFNGDTYSDLVIGVPFEDLGTQTIAGGVNILYGSSVRLTATGNQFWSQDSTDIQEIVESYDRFGWAMAEGDFNGDGRTDLAVGAPGEVVAGKFDAGAVNILFGSGTGIGSANNQLWFRGQYGYGAPANDDLFGAALASSR